MAAVLAAGMLCVGLVGSAGAGESANTVLTVGKIVSGPATEGSSVRIECPSPTEGAQPFAVVFTFDASGKAVSADIVNDAIEIVDGRFVVSGNSKAIRDCTANEIATGGAVATSWTCEYHRDPPADPNEVEAEADPVVFGCAAPSGVGTGPVSILFGTPEDGIKLQDATLLFTNTYVAPAVVSPTFTG